MSSVSTEESSEISTDSETDCTVSPSIGKILTRLVTTTCRIAFEK
jgi:hypothetical protein